MRKPRSGLRSGVVAVDDDDVDGGGGGGAREGVVG